MEERKLLHERGSGNALVGAFVLVAVLIFSWLLLFQRDRTDRYRLVAEFNTISDLNEGTKVKLRGFTIGQVEGIEFHPQPPSGQAFFLIELGIEKQYAVATGTVAEIRSSGLVGDAFIHLDVGQAKEAALPPGSHIKGRDAMGMKQLMVSITEMAHKLGGAGESIRRADLGYKLGRLGDSMHQVATGLERVSHSADSLLVVSREMVETLQPEVSRVLVGLEQNLGQLNRTIGHTDTLVMGSSADVERSLKALRQAVERLDQVLQRVDGMVQGKQAEIDSTLDNLHAASKAAREISEHPWKLITGQGKKEGVEEE